MPTPISINSSLGDHLLSINSGLGDNSLILLNGCASGSLLNGCTSGSLGSLPVSGLSVSGLVSGSMFFNWSWKYRRGYKLYAPLFSGQLSG